MKVLIIEDEAPAFRQLQKVLEMLVPNVEIVEVLGTVEECVTWFEKSPEVDLVFMDIQLRDGLSFQIFDQVNINIPIIFTTAFDEYLLKAFKVNSIDYLLKPIKKDELQKSLLKYNNLKTAFSQPEGWDINELIRKISLDNTQYKSRFLVKMADSLIAIETADVAYFLTRNGLVYLVNLSDRKYPIDMSLDEIIQKLDPSQFFRANRQHIVHFKAIEKVHKYHNGKLLLEIKSVYAPKITISVEKAGIFKQWFGHN